MHLVRSQPFRCPARGTLVAALLALALPAGAQAAIYRCVSESGVVEYSNTEPAKDRAASCRKLDLPPVTTIPAPAVPQPAAGGAPSAPVPSVSADAQSRRDEQRLQILRDEYRREATRLGELQAEYKDGQPDRLGSERNYQKYLDRVERLKNEIARTEANLQALRSEMKAAGD